MSSSFYCGECGDTKALVGVPCTECGAMPNRSLTFPVPTDEVGERLNEEAQGALAGAARRAAGELWRHWNEDTLILMLDLKWHGERVVAREYGITI